MTHTINGPWKPQTSPHREGLWETIDKRNGYLGKSFYNRDNAIAWCAEQNERALMEAAPALLESCRALLKLHIAHHNEPVHAAARAAIARATGEA